ncbi:MAG: TonB-dependent receptor plug domain-containing protein [Cytophagales bacterium]|nr:TonB-dependent receptor plug domain-containing protein [Cytophagales bacterium]
MIMNKSILILIVLTHFQILNLSFAQTAEIRGFLLDKESEEPIIYTTVYLRGTNYGTSSDVNGYFSITKVPPGNYTLMVSSIRYDSLSMPVSLKAGRILTKKYFLKEAIKELETVEVKGIRINKQENVNISITTISPREIRIMPSIGGEPDLAQYLQILPGVISTGDQAGQLYIRGGAPVQNLILLDGMVIYNPFHSIGLFSVFDTDILRSVDVYTGGFNSQYGGRISAVIDIVTNDGNKKRLSGKIAAGPFTSKIMLEGPIVKAETGKGSISYILSGRSSYLDKSSKVFYSYIDKDGLPYSFNDLYGKITLTGPVGSKVSFYGFRFDDKASLIPGSVFKWNSFGIGSRFLLLPAGSSVLISGIFAYSNYKIGITEATISPRNSEVNGFNGSLNFTYFIKKHELKYGIEVLGNKTQFVGFSPVGIKQELLKFNTELAGYFKSRIVIHQPSSIKHQPSSSRPILIIEPGLRLHYYASLNNLFPEPRLGLKYNLNNRVRLKVAGGLYAQNLIATRSDRDVVNLFVGFISSPEIIYDYKGDRIDNKLQKARHLIGGVEIDLRSNIEVNIEPYVKDFIQLVNINRDRIERDDPEYIVETGLAKGIDLLVKYDYKKLYFQTGYSFASVERKFGSETYYPNFDRRHNLNIIASYTGGTSWVFAARWNLGSGFPFTQTAGFYQDITFQGGIDTDITTANGQLGILYAEYNKGRLPWYHRLDLSVKKTFQFSKYSALEINASVINVYNRANLFYFDRVNYTRVNQLPILPSVGVNLRF